MSIYKPFRVQLITTTRRCWHYDYKNQYFDVIKATPDFYFCADTEHNRKVLPERMHTQLRSEKAYISIGRVRICEYNTNKDASILLAKEL